MSTVDQPSPPIDPKRLANALRNVNLTAAATWAPAIAAEYERLAPDSAPAVSKWCDWHHGYVDEGHVGFSRMCDACADERVPIREPRVVLP